MTSIARVQFGGNAGTTPMGRSDHLRAKKAVESFLQQQGPTGGGPLAYRDLVVQQTGRGNGWSFSFMADVPPEQNAGWGTNSGPTTKQFVGRWDPEQGGIHVEEKGTSERR
jgi:hypothetical protein